MTIVMNIVNFILAHQVVEAGLIVAVLDFAFAMKSGLEANGILHAIYLFAKGKSSPAPAA
jgi:hypothetical protein